MPRQVEVGKGNQRCGGWPSGLRSALFPTKEEMIGRCIPTTPRKIAATC